MPQAACRWVYLKFVFFILSHTGWSVGGLSPHSSDRGYFEPKSCVILMRDNISCRLMPPSIRVVLSSHRRPYCAGINKPRPEDLPSRSIIGRLRLSTCDRLPFAVWVADVGALTLK
ncbi:hypothetical protein FB567DRAFT_27815 [Paraphoma chrysanthemicola]|uniref:Secreted protein n=1 Tax=Paraphoma chrysanthemicola TaxID=798071 RepID=A0A8K0RK80_9PLEO|nr:hypothetical protein FB567DRAFT_27815 [Paraphoma chrysanthemicola]